MRSAVASNPSALSASAEYFAVSIDDISSLLKTWDNEIAPQSKVEGPHVVAQPFYTYAHHSSPPFILIEC